MTDPWSYHHNPQSFNRNHTYQYRYNNNDDDEEEDEYLNAYRRDQHLRIAHQDHNDDDDDDDDDDGNGITGYNNNNNNNNNNNGGNEPPMILTLAPTNTRMLAPPPMIRPQKRSKMKLRWLVLTCACILCAGNYYSYDLPAAIYSKLDDVMNQQDSEKDFTTHFNLLYTCYSVPNIILPFFGGHFVDRWGSKSCVLFAVLLLLGQLIFTVGVDERNWYIMLLGRTVYGLGGENLTVSSSALLANWFVGSELGMSFGIQLAMGRLGSVLNNFVSPRVASEHGVTTACWVGVGCNAISLLMSFCLHNINHQMSVEEEQFRKSLALSAHSELSYSLMEDYRRTTKQGIDPDEVSLPDDMKHDEDGKMSIHCSDQQKSSDGQSTAVSTNSGSSIDEPRFKCSDIARFGILFWLLCLCCLVVYGCIVPFNNVVSGILLERDYFLEPPDSCTLRYDDQCTEGDLAPRQGNPSRDGLRVCPASGYAPVLPTYVNYTKDNYENWDSSWSETEYVFEDLTRDDVNCEDTFWSDACVKNFCDAKDDALVRAGRMMSTPYILCAALAPFIGGYADKFGNRAVLAMVAPSILIAVHSLLGFSKVPPIVPMLGQGLGHSLFASVIWPSVTLVEPESTGVAYGIMTSVQNVGLSTFPLMVATIHNEHEQFIPGVEIFFITLASLGLLFGIMLHVKDGKLGGKLNGTSTDPTGEIEHSDVSLLVSDSATFD